jgi:AraC-like DNA-binding protein
MDLLSGITSAIALGISIILLLATWGWVRQGKGERQTHYYLLALLAVVCLQLCELIYHSFALHERWPVLIKLVDPLVVMAPFLLFAYISGLKGKLIHYRGMGVLHLLPGIYVLAWDIPFWLLPGPDKILYMEQGYLTAHSWTRFVPYRSDYLAILAALILVYWWQVRALLSQKSGPTSRMDSFIQRVRQAMLLLAIWMIACAISGYGSGTNMILSIGAGILVGYLCYFFLLQARMPRVSSVDMPVTGLTSGSSNEAENFIGAKNNPASETQLAFKELEKHLSQGLFKDNELSLAKLAETSGLNVHLASKAINECSGGNFYDWVNLYRVEQAKSLLLESDGQVSRICYDVGFNSKSTFYAAFKKVTGLTPGAFRKQQG